MKIWARIYYVPGWVSLALLLVLCILFFHKREVFKKEAIIKVYTCRASDLGKGFTANFPQRQFSNVFSIGKEAAPEIAVLKSDIQKLMATVDTIEGIKIHFTPHSKYQSLVSILDILIAEKVRWWLIEDNIWVWYNPPPVSTMRVYPIHLCGTGELQKQQIAELLKKERKAQTVQAMKNICYTLWASWLLFIALVFFATAFPSRYKR
jgi:hypothetical protein